MTTNQLTTSSKSYQLHRYPDQSAPNLRAWSAADELLIDYVLMNAQPDDKLTILNDEFGALGCALGDYASHWYSDSFIACQAFKNNRQRNQQQEPTTLSSLTDLKPSDWILMRLPKNLAYLEHQLSQISQIATPQTRIVASGMVKNLPKAVFNLFERYLGPVTTSLAQKKSRLLFCEMRQTPQTSPYPKSWSDNDHGWQLEDHANLFCLGKLDIGTRFLLDNMPVGDYQQVVDLGCGNGLLTLQALQHYPQANILSVDESYMAVKSASRNVSLNRPKDLSRCRFIQDNCLESQPDNWAELVLCNPPFHQQNTISTHIAAQMFSDAYRCLKPGGQLCVIANRHLPYQGLLKKQFGDFKVLASNPKFVILITNCKKVADS